MSSSTSTGTCPVGRASERPFRVPAGRLPALAGAMLLLIARPAGSADPPAPASDPAPAAVDADMLRDLELLSDPEFARSRDLARRLRLIERLRMIESLPLLEEPAGAPASAPTRETR